MWYLIWLVGLVLAILFTVWSTLRLEAADRQNKPE